MNAQKYIEQSSTLENYFSDFTSADIEKIEVLEYQAGTFIKDDNTEGHSVFFLVKGIGAVYSKIENGELFRYYYVIKDDVFGFSDVIAPNNKISDFSVKAMSDVVVLKIKKTLLNKFIIEYPKLENKIVIGLLERLHWAITFQVECKKYNSTINIVSYLIFSYEIFHTMDDSNYTGYVAINETRSSISDFTGISIRSINNTIDLLKKLNYISIVKGKVNINSKEYNALKNYKANNI
jgi:CRP-like cAMP-binding protein